MAYSIQYGRASIRNQFRRMKGTKQSTRLKSAIICSLILTALICGKLGYLDFLIPGDKEVTKEAFSDMLDSLQGGEDLKEAVSTFCEEIFSVAQQEQ